MPKDLYPDKEFTICTKVPINPIHTCNGQKNRKEFIKITADYTLNGYIPDKLSWRLFICGDNGNIQSTAIDYCPFCGVKL